MGRVFRAYTSLKSTGLTSEQSRVDCNKDLLSKKKIDYSRHQKETKMVLEASKGSLHPDKDRPPPGKAHWVLYREMQSEDHRFLSPGFLRIALNLAYL